MRYLILFCLWLSLSAEPFFCSTASCAWQAVTLYTDGSQVQGAVVVYNIYRALRSDLADAVLVGTTTDLTFIDRTAPRKTRCYYFAKAVVNGKESVKSNTGVFYSNKP